MKKGFTLIEIIISISLILIIGTSVTVFYIKGKKDNTLNLLFKQLIECSQLYMENEYDENGITYKNGLLSGGKAVVIPLNELEEKGYLSNEMIKTLEDKNITKDEYILAGVFEDTKDLCSSSDAVIKFEASWNDKLKGLDEPVYICGYANKKSEEDIPVDSLLKYLRTDVEVDKYAVSEEFYDNATDEQKKYLTPNENGLFFYWNQKTDKKYVYYRGAVDNNYIELGEYTNESGQKEPLKWRIVWINDDKHMKIVLDKAVPLTITSDTGVVKNVKDIKNIDGENEKMSIFTNYALNFQGRSPIKFVNPVIEHNPKTYGSNTYYTIKVTEDDIFNTMGYYNYETPGMYTYSTSNGSSDHSFYINKLYEWFDNSTNLSNYDFIAQNNNFCTGHASDGSSDYAYYSTDFGCVNGFEVNSKTSFTFSTDNNVSSKIGLLEYVDLARAGFPFVNKINYNGEINIDFLNSGNYLINNTDENNSFITSSYANKSKSISGGNSDVSVSYYYYSRNGTRSNNIFYERGYKYSYNTYYEIRDSNSKGILFGHVNPDTFLIGMDDIHFGTYTFLGNALKPSIILDMSDVKLSDNSGTKDDSYTIVSK